MKLASVTSKSFRTVVIIFSATLFATGVFGKFLETAVQGQRKKFLPPRRFPEKR
jgi:hypothetical protein